MKDRKEKILDDLYIDKKHSEDMISNFENNINTYNKYINEERLILAQINDLIRKLEK